MMRTMGLKPTREAICNELLARIPLVDVRMRGYRRIGAQIDPARTTIMMHTDLIAPRRIAIGDASIIGRHCLLDGRGGIKIGDNVNISSYSLLITGAHDPHSSDFGASYEEIAIEDHVWLASRTTVLAGVSIGRGAVVAAGAVVTRDLEPMTIYAGVPAKPIGVRKVEPTYTLAYRPNWD